MLSYTRRLKTKSQATNNKGIEEGKAGVREREREGGRSGGRERKGKKEEKQKKGEKKAVNTLLLPQGCMFYVCSQASRDHSGSGWEQPQKSSKIPKG